MQASYYVRMGKRQLDIVLAAAGLIVLAPFLLLIALLLMVAQGRPVLFSQERPGLDGELFRVYKFRTMLNTRDKEGNLLPDAERLTRIGNFVRRSSIDELPGLWNVLIGRMSIVGPRPLLPEYLAKYTPEQARRHEVRPGITGRAQVSGRQAIPFSERLALDVWYVDNVSLRVDVQIIMKTLRQVLARQGVIPGQDVADVDDLGLSEDLGPYGVPDGDKKRDY